MTAQEAYNLDCQARPFYHDGTPRKTWEQLGAYARLTWEHNPTPRAYNKPAADIQPCGCGCEGKKF